MGYELFEQVGWECTDAVFYPTGGGVGLIGKVEGLCRIGGTWPGSGRTKTEEDRGAIAGMCARRESIRRRCEGELDVAGRRDVCFWSARS
jgi:hypothetical protein